VSDLTPLSPALADLLDGEGVVDTCFDGTVPRIDPAKVLRADVSTQLALGIELPGEALQGGASPLVLYEVSHSCARIRVCKVDLDGDPANGTESLRVGLPTCAP
jgi:hypothetical protein